MARRLGLEVEFIARRLAPRRRSGAIEARLARRPRARDQGGVRRAQRDLDRRHHPHRRGAPGDRRGAASGAAHGRHDLLARLDRLPPRRVGRRRHRRRLAEGADAAAGPVVQRASATRRWPRRKTARLPRSYWDWDDDAGAKQDRLLSLHAGDQPALRPARGARRCCDEEGLDNVFARHDRHAEATRRAVRAWGLEMLCADPREYSSSLTAVLMPDGPRRRRAARRSSSSASTCRSAPASASSRGKVFRIGHLGDFNDLMLAGTLAGVEMGLKDVGFPLAASGVAAALDHLSAGPRAAAGNERAQPDFPPRHDRRRRAAAARCAGGASRSDLRGRRRRQEDHALSAGRSTSGRGHGPDRADLHRGHGAAAQVARRAGDRGGAGPGWRARPARGRATPRGLRAAFA